MDQKEIIQRLTEGNHRFALNKLQGNESGDKQRKELLTGQNPYAIILSCADSRVVPEMIFDTGLGELFVVRVAGNIANTSSIASIEYAVAHLGTSVIVVLGHQNCGAVTAAVKGGDNGHNINQLIAHIIPAIHNSPDGASVDDVIRKNAHLTSEQLVNRSSIISEAIKQNKLKIVTAYYQLESGRVEFL